MTWRYMRQAKQTRLPTRMLGVAAALLASRKPYLRLSEVRKLYPESMPHHTAGLGRREQIDARELSAFPYASICHIWGDRRNGTGFLVEDGRILTAGHIVYGANLRNIQFPGHSPFQVSGNAQIRCHPNFKQEGDLFDYGIITPPPQLIAGITALPMVKPDLNLLKNVLCEVAGYPQEINGMVRYPPHRTPPVDTRLELRLENGFLEHKFDTTPGQSGAPILGHTFSNPQQWFVIGMHIWGAGDLAPGYLNRALPISST